MKERLMFEEYENLFNGVVVKNRQGMTFVPEHRVGTDGHLERLGVPEMDMPFKLNPMTEEEKADAEKLIAYRNAQKPAVTADLDKGKDTTVKTVVNKR